MQPSNYGSLLRRWRRLSASERRLLIEAWLLLGVTSAGLILLRFGVVRGWLDRCGRRTTQSDATPDRTAWAVAAAARRVPGGATCLPQALVCNAMLQRRGYATRLHIGVASRAEIGRPTGHAWVEMDDRVIIGDLDNLEAYVPLRRST